MSVKHSIDDIVRRINPETFDPTVHGEGLRIVVSKGVPSVYRPSLLGRLFGSSTDVHYFIKSASVPRAIQGWELQWSEGTSAIALDFKVSFVIQANEEAQAIGLVRALHGVEEPGPKLFGLIQTALHEELDQLLRQPGNILENFSRTSTGIGESPEIDRRVSSRVGMQLSGAHFRVGFRLINMPPLQIEVASRDEFSMQDSKRPCNVETTVLLQLDNYQTFKKSGLKSEQQVQDTLRKIINDAVREIMFAQKYITIVCDFKDKRRRDLERQAGNERDRSGSHEISIFDRMESRIRAAARTLGYGVKMFQTIPDIAALKLLDPLRIHIESNKADKYYLKDSTKYIHLSVVLNVSLQSRGQSAAGPELSRLHLLIEPDEADVAGPIIKRVKEVCADTVWRVTYQEASLEFDSKVAEMLRRDIVETLACYDLLTDVVHIRQDPNEDVLRFRAIVGRTIDFATVISAQADAGQSDDVPISGAIEVVAMTPDGWESFDRKDLGFRQDSNITDEQMRAIAQRRGIPVPPEPAKLHDTARRGLAIELELAEIRERVIATLHKWLSKVQSLATLLSNHKQSERIFEKIEEAVEADVGSEFGLNVKLRGIRCLDTATIITASVQRSADHVFLRGIADQNYKLALESNRRTREVTEDNKLQMMATLAQEEREILRDVDHPRAEEVRQKVQRSIEHIEAAPTLTVEAATARLKRAAAAAAATALLPWEQPSLPPSPPTASNDNPPV